MAPLKKKSRIALNLGEDEDEDSAPVGDSAAEDDEDAPPPLPTYREYQQT
jgi:hypothetical protein